MTNSEDPQKVEFKLHKILVEEHSEQVYTDLIFIRLQFSVSNNFTRKMNNGSSEVQEWLSTIIISFYRHLVQILIFQDDHQYFSLVKYQ